MKRFVSLIFAVLILATVFPSLVYAADLHLIDEEGLLTEQEASEVEACLSDVSGRLGVDVFVRTAVSFDGKEPYYYADDALDYDFGTVNDGILFLISTQEGETFISTVGKCKDVFSEDNVDSIYDAFFQDVRDKNYKSAFTKFANAVEKYYKYETAVFHFNATSIIVPLIVGLIIALVIVGMMKGSLKSARFHNAGVYLKDGSLNLTRQSDLFLYTTVTRTQIKDSSSSSSHSGSSGSSHGGHGRSI